MNTYYNSGAAVSWVAVHQKCCTSAISLASHSGNLKHLFEPFTGNEFEGNASFSVNLNDISIDVDKCIQIQQAFEKCLLPEYEWTKEFQLQNGTCSFGMFFIRSPLHIQLVSINFWHLRLLWIHTLLLQIASTVWWLLHWMCHLFTFGANVSKISPFKDTQRMRTIYNIFSRIVA